MIDENDWRLLNDVDDLKNAEIKPTDGEELFNQSPQLKHCKFYLEPVLNDLHQLWFVTTDLSCCICEDCYNDFNELFKWIKRMVGMIEL